jgi:hypothetical protein
MIIAAMPAFNEEATLTKLVLGALVRSTLTNGKLKD